MQGIEKQKKIFFYSVLVLLPEVILILLEVLLRLFSYGDDLSLFIPAKDERYLVCNQGVGKRFFSRLDETTPLNEIFLKDKHANGIRIFVMGESTVQGFPYDENLSFPRILQFRLKDIFPNRNIEVVNLGMTAVSSYTLADFASEVIEQKPDAVLIYTGHNEYYGAMGVASMESGSVPSFFKGLHLSFIHFRSYQLVQNLVRGVYTIFSSETEDEKKETLMRQIVGKNVIPFDSDTYREGLEQFRTNMGELLSELKNAGIPVIISDLVSNTRDQYPFYSLGKEKDERADSVYENAKVMEQNTLFVKAKEEYLKAKDLDAIRFRAAEDLNEVIQKLSHSWGIFPVSIKTIFEEYSPNSLVGDNLITEHLHPNIDGYFLMSEAFLKALKNNSLIEANWPGEIKPWNYYRNNWGYTEVDSAIASLRIANLKSGWPFKPENTVNNFIFSYKPSSLVDSMAFLAVKYDNVNSEKIHKDLAEYYKSNRDYKRASKEYRALAYTYPYNSSYYYIAADYAIKAEDYQSALKILNESPDPDTSSYAQLTFANIYYSEKNFPGALTSLNKLEKIQLSKDNYLLTLKLKYKVLKSSGDEAAALQVLSKIKNVEPGFSENKESKQVLVLLSEMVKPYIEQAEILRRSGRMKEAYDLLLQANSIEETPYANLLIGKILLSQKQLSAIPYMEKAYRDIKNDPSLVFNLCLLYLMKNDIPKAEEKMYEYFRMDGENSAKARQLKDIYLKTIEHNKSKN